MTFLHRLTYVFWLYGGTNTISGTSMATPHVAGAGALYLQNDPSAAPVTVNSWIINNATPNVIYNNPSGTPNRLLFIGDASTPPPPPTPTPWERPPPDCGTYYC